MLAAAIVAAPDDGGDRPVVETIFPTFNLYPAAALAAGEPEMETVTVAYPVPTDDTRCVVVRADRRQALPVRFCQQLAPIRPRPSRRRPGRCCPPQTCKMVAAMRRAG